MYRKLKIVPPVSEGLNLGMSHVPSHNWHFWIFVCPCSDFYHNHLTLKKRHLPNAGIRNPWTLACVQTNPWILRFSKIWVNPGDHRLKYTSTPQNQIAHYINYAYFLVNTQRVPTVKGFSMGKSNETHHTWSNLTPPTTTTQYPSFGGPRLSLACRRTSSWTNPWHLVDPRHPRYLDPQKHTKPQEVFGFLGLDSVEKTYKEVFYQVMIHKQELIYIIIWYPLKKVIDFFSGSKVLNFLQTQKRAKFLREIHNLQIDGILPVTINTPAPLSLVYSPWSTSARTFVSNSLWTCVERNPECTTLNVEHSSVTSRDKTTNLTWWRPDCWTKSQQFCWFPSGRHLRSFYVQSGRFTKKTTTNLIIVIGLQQGVP